MLVDHDVEPDLVAQRELVEIAVEQAMTDLRIVMGVGQHNTQGASLQPFVPGRVIGHLREVPDTHPLAPFFRFYSLRPSTNAVSRSAKACGCSQCGKCPAPGMTSILSSWISRLQPSP